jgi:uncharacterized protein YciI
VLYAILATDMPNSLALRRATRARHLAYLEPLLEAGRVLAAGPTPAIDSPDPGPAGFSGSLIIAEFESLDAARDWADHDPYSTSGVFAQIVVKPFIRVAP